MRIICDTRKGVNVATNEEQNRFVQSLIAENARKEAEKKALIEEFTKSIPQEWSPEDLKEKLRGLTAQAYARIAQTIKNDDEPALAFQAAKYVFSFATGTQKITDANDPNKELNELLRTLTPKKHDSPAAQTIENEASSTETES